MNKPIMVRITGIVNIYKACIDIPHQYITYFDEFGCYTAEIPEEELKIYRPTKKEQPTTTKTKKAQLIKRHLKDCLHLTNTFSFDKVEAHTEAINYIRNSTFDKYKGFCLFKKIVWYPWG